MAREMKDSGVEWIGKIPDNWTLKRLQWCLKEIIEKNDPIKTTQILSLTNRQGVLPYEDKGLQGNKAKENVAEYKLAYENTLIVNSMNVIIGSVGISHYFGCVSPVYYVFRETDESDLRFINYIFNTMGFQKECRKYAKGIMEIRLRISSSDLFKRPIALPLRSKQVRIADYLDFKCAEIDEILDKTYTSIEEYKKLKQATITQAVTKGIRGDRPMKNSGIEWIGEVPSHWVKTKVKWLLVERKDKSERGNEEPLSMSQKYGLIPTKNMDMVPNMASSFVGAKLVRKQDLVFNKLKAHLGVFSVSNYDGLVSPDYAVYYSSGLVDVKFLEYLFKTPQCITEFKKKSTGVAAGLTRLYTDGLYSIYCALPPLDEQQQIVNYLNSKISEIDNIILKKGQYFAEIEAYKKSLIYEYVTGKKEVR